VLPERDVSSIRIYGFFRSYAPHLDFSSEVRSCWVQHFHIILHFSCMGLIWVSSFVGGSGGRDIKPFHSNARRAFDSLPFHQKWISKIEGEGLS